MTGAPTLLPDALARRRAAEHDIELALRREYPIGAVILFEDHSYRLRKAVVRHHCYGDRIIVETLDTHRQRKLYASMLRDRLMLRDGAE